MKNRWLTLCASLFLSISVTHAALSFSEIMYDPEGSDSNREWVEVRNDGDALNLTSYKLFESSTNHSITSSHGGATLPSGGFAVIADDPTRFLQDFPGYTGLLFDSSFSLSNAGEFLSLKDSGGQVTDSLTYSPGNGGSDDGTTLSLVQGVWVRGDVTPGADNVVSTKLLTSASSSKAVTVSSINAGPAPDLTVFVPEERLVVAGADALFTATALSSGGSEPTGVMYDWSFGDGGARTGKSVTYRYAEPGYYAAVVDASNGTLFAKNRIRVHVVAPTVFITDIKKTEEKILVSVTNPSPYEIDVGSWKINNNGAYYPLPKNTILLPRATTTLNALEFGMATSTSALGTTSFYFPGGQLLASSTYIPRHKDNRDFSKKEYVLAVSKEDRNKSKESKKAIEGDASLVHNTPPVTSTTKKDRKILTWITSYFR